MEVHIYSVKTKSEASNIWVNDIMATQKGKSFKVLWSGSLKFMLFKQNNS